MIIIFLLVPLSILTAGIFLVCFIWAVKSGQYEDAETPAMRVLAGDSDAAKKGAAKLSAVTAREASPKTGDKF